MIVFIKIFEPLGNATQVCLCCFFKKRDSLSFFWYLHWNRL